MYRIVTFGILMIFCGSIAGATTVNEADGGFWMSLSLREQNVAMYAALAAYRDAYARASASDELYYSSYMDNLSKQPFMTTQLAARLAGWKARYALTHRLPSNADTSGTLESYVDGASNFYARHPELRSITLGQLIRCLKRDSGISCDEMARNILDRDYAPLVPVPIESSR